MAGYTIGQFSQHNRIIFEPRAVTVQTPTHIHILQPDDGLLANLAVAIFAIETRGDMWAMAVIDKIR